MSDNGNSIIGIVRVVGGIIKFTLLLLILVISILSGVVFLLYNLYKHEKNTASEQESAVKEEPESA